MKVRYTATAAADLDDILSYLARRNPKAAGLVYPVHVMTRKSFGLMTRKLSVTESQRSAQFPEPFHAEN